MKKKRVNEGLKSYRLRDNPEEKRIANAWEKFETQGQIVNHILDSRPVHSGHPPEASDRDRAVAATFLQWLGSPVGQHFLTEVLGYAKTSKKTLLDSSE